MNTEKKVMCMYCREERDEKDIEYVRIFSPNWKSSGYRSPPRPYCKDRQCAGNDQMAHED